MTDNYNLNLKKFNIKSIKDNSVIALIGKRETGKSFLTKDLLYHKRDFPVGVVISATENANSFYSNFIPKVFIHDEYKQSIVKNVLKCQEKSVKKKHQCNQIGQSYDSRCFLILDDCLYDAKWGRDTEIRRIFMNGRHYDVLFILTMQYPLGILPNLRTNIDYTFILRENIMNNRKKIYENYAGMFPDLATFCQVMDACTENYECLVIHNNAKSNKIEDQVFWYKAEKHEDFRLGHDRIWYESSKYEEQRKANENSDEEEDLLASMSKSKKKNKITVKKN